MEYLCALFRSLVSRRILHAVVATIALTLIAAAPASALSVKGRVVSDGTGLANYRVSLYGVFFVAGRTQWRRLGVAKATGAGKFRIVYALPTGENPLLFVQARRGKVMLASAIGRASRAPTQIVVNPRTTVAAGTAYAQFVSGQKIVGNTYGMINAARMAANLANPQTGAVGKILARALSD